MVPLRVINSALNAAKREDINGEVVTPGRDKLRVECG